MVSVQSFDVQAFHEGRRDVLESVYRAHLATVARVARFGYRYQGGRRCVPGVAAPDVADVVQDVFVRAFRESARRSFDGRREYGAYLIAIARNVLCDHVRRRRCLEWKSDETIAEAARPDPHERSQYEALQEAISQYIDTLPSKQREVYDYRYVRFQSQVATAAAMGVTRQYVRTQERKLQSGLLRALRRAQLY